MSRHVGSGDPGSADELAGSAPAPSETSSGADVRWIILSDLHLGERDSVLTPLDDGGRVTPHAEATVLDALAECVGELVGDPARRPGLLLAGDLLGLAFATLPFSLSLFGRLARRVLDEESGSCGEIIYLPGNHDHHVWEITREAEYARRLTADGWGGDAEASPDPPPVFHSTAPTVDAGLRCPALDAVLPESVREAVRVVYPNLLLSAGERRVLVHHGHFAEALYHGASRVRRALYPNRAPVRTVEQLEGENFAWIDFVWSLVGRSGEASADFERLYRTLSTADHLERRADELAARIAESVDFPSLPFEAAERVLARTLLERIASLVRSERHNHAEVCSPKTMRGLAEYLSGPAREQLSEAKLSPETGDAGGRGEAGGPGNAGAGPPATTVVWGHTHKPFSKRAPLFAGGPPVAVHNTGGWTVDSHQPAPLKGASMVLLSDELEAASLRVWDDGEDGGDIRLDVETVGESPSRFAERLAARVRPGGEPSPAWARLGDLLADEVRRRRAIHRARHGEEAP